MNCKMEQITIECSIKQAIFTLFYFLLVNLNVLINYLVNGHCVFKELCN